jgi:phage shock protein PspC (stress-responsive transcriptional regulator)
MARLTKSETDKMLFGVCGGLADYMNMDSTVMRVLFVLITVFGIGSPILVYLILALIMPSD